MEQEVMESWGTVGEKGLMERLLDRKVEGIQYGELETDGWMDG